MKGSEKISKEGSIMKKTLLSPLLKGYFKLSDQLNYPHYSQPSIGYEMIVLKLAYKALPESLHYAWELLMIIFFASWAVSKSV